MAHHYELYGLRIASNKKLPLLTPVHHSHVDVSIDLSNQLIPELLSITQQQPSIAKHDVKQWHTPDWFCIEFLRSSTQALRFYISMDGSRVVSNKPQAIPDSDVDSFILGPILACALRLRGQVCLHASVLESNGKAFAMIGQKGAGKSTTAGALLQAGARLVSDDIAVVDKSDTGRFTVQSGYAGVRLMPDALSTFALSQADYPQVVSISDKRVIPLTIGQSNKQANPSWEFQPKACQLVAIYILNTRQADIKKTHIRELPNTQAFIELSPHSYARGVANAQQKNQEFAFMAQLAKHTPIKSVDRPDQLSCLPEIAHELLSDLASIA